MERLARAKCGGVAKTWFQARQGRQNVRITNQIIQQEALGAIQRSLSGMAEAQAQVASGVRVQKVSDDPVAGKDILRTGSRLRALDQYSRNIDAATSRLNSEENALSQMTNILTRVKELGVAMATGTVDAQGRQAAKEEVDGLYDTVVGLANTTSGNGYLFGGATADVKPFNDDGSVAANAVPQGQAETEIGSGIRMVSNHDGTQVFVDTNVFTALKDLSDALGANDQQAVQAALPGVDTAFDNVQELLGEVGARSSSLQIAGANVDALNVNLQTFKSDLQDVDLEEAMSNLVNRQVAYQAALAATSRIMSTTLADYL